MMQARWYQSAAYGKTLEYVAQYPDKHPLIVCPTGAGKSFIAAMLTSHFFKNDWVLILGPTSNIIMQDYAAILDFIPEEKIGIYSAKLKRKEIRPVTIASINSIHRKAELFKLFKYIIIDEAHLIGTTQDGMYRRLFAILTKATVIGLTATPFRTGTGSLVGTEKALFDEIVFDVPIIRLIKEGYLCPLKTKDSEHMMDVSGIKTVAGDFSKKGLSEQLDQSGITQGIVEDLLTYKTKRKKWLVFAIDINHANHVAELLNEAGIKTGLVHSGQSTEINDITLLQFKQKQIQTLVSVSSLTTGFDDPEIDLIALLRPTKSPVLHIQMIGRGLRIFLGKINCIAEGQKVLTNKGLVKIESVTKNHLLWDGVAWVTHDGAIYKGKQKVITYAGITATKDHKVWTKEGWKTLWRCTLEQTPIQVTGYGRLPVRFFDGIFSKNNTERKIKQSLFKDTMHTMWPSKTNSIRYFKKRFSWLPQLWAKNTQRKTFFRCSQVYIKSVHSSKIKMLQQKRSQMERLWWAWYSVFIQNPITNGNAFDAIRFVRENKEVTNRQNKQQRQLRKRKLATNLKQSKLQQSTEKLSRTLSALFCIKVPKNKIFCWPFKISYTKRTNRQRNNSKVSCERYETQRVWDIVNSGPRNCFTCEGKLVSNCLIVDFAGNINRLGPINDVHIKIKGKKGGAAPIKTCPGCQTHVPALAKQCYICGYDFPPPVSKLNLKSSNLKVLVDNVKEDLPIGWFPVSNVTYSNYLSMKKINSMRVTYTIAPNKKIHEYINPFAKTKKGYNDMSWLKFRLGYMPYVETVSDMMQLTTKLDTPVTLKVDLSGSYPKILDATFR